jgi:hypothetical protein
MGELLPFMKNIFVMYAKKDRQILLEVCNFAKHELLRSNPQIANPQIVTFAESSTFVKFANLTICYLGKLFPECPPLTVCQKNILSQQKNFLTVFINSVKIATSAALQS